MSLDGNVMDLSPASTSSSTSSSDSSDLSDDSLGGCKAYTELTAPTVSRSSIEALSEAPTLDWVIIKMLEREQAQQLHREKIEACHQNDLPLDPWKWTATDVTKWVSWLMRKISPNDTQDAVTMFETYPITGETLANFNVNDLQSYFGENAEKAYNSLKNWLDGMSPRGYDIQRQLLELENAKQAYLDRLYDEVNLPDNLGATADVPAKTSPALTPPYSDYDTPLQPLDALRGINSNMAVHHMKSEETTAFPFPDPCMSEYHPVYHPHPFSYNSQVHHGVSGGIGMPSACPENLESPLEKSYVLDIDPETDEQRTGHPIKKEPHCPSTPIKRKRGRPRKPKIPKPKRDQPILYKFILKHLNDTTGDSKSYVEWVNKSEGLFRFYSAKKDEFAEMWGRFKGKRDQMTYQNMARALRNYTRGVGNRKIMTSVRKKLHYKFTPTFIK